MSRIAAYHIDAVNIPADDLRRLPCGNSGGGADLCNKPTLFFPRHTENPGSLCPPALISGHEVHGPKPFVHDAGAAGQFAIDELLAKNYIGTVSNGEEAQR